MNEKDIYAQYDREEPFDLWCPLCGAADNETPNYYKGLCGLRQRDPAQASTCYPECKPKKLIALRKKYELDALKSGQTLPETKREQVELMLQADEPYTLREIASVSGISTTTISRIKHELGMIP